jgi:hypothetical protein
MGPASTTWFLHVDLACTEEPCNCGIEEATMDDERRNSECAVQGARSPLSPFVSNCGGKECYSASTAFPGYTAGTAVEGMLFMTSDVPEDVAVHISLVTEGRAAGGTSVEAALHGTLLSQVDNEWRWTEVPFSFHLDGAVHSDRNVSLVVAVDYLWSYFIGHDEAHPSGFTIGGAHVVD